MAASRRTKGPPVLETPRLRLRPFTKADLGGLHALYGDAEAMRYWSFPASRDRAETARRLRWHVGGYRPSGYAIWAVATKRSDRCIGMVNYHHREARERRLEVGYIVARSQWGKGLASEAMRAVVRHCIDALRTHRIEAMIAPENAASRRLAEGLGFRCEGGPLRDRWRVGDGWRSVLVYGLIAGEEKT
jgi:ribosomal-protein-alanine N-acetyltransferase